MADQVFRDRRHFAVLRVAVLGLDPLERQVYDGAGSIDLYERLQGCAQGRQVRLAIAGVAHQAAERKLDARQAGHAHRRRQVGNIGQRNG